MTVSIRIETPTGVYLQSAYARQMPTALRDAIADAHNLVSAQRPDVYLRDCLGGLRAEVRWRDGKVVVRKT